MMKYAIGLLALLSSLLVLSDEKIDSIDGLGGTGLHEPGEEEGIGGTGRSLERPELPERPELMQRPEFDGIDGESIDVDAGSGIDSPDIPEPTE